MKKLLKSKIFLAIMAVAIVSSVLMASTYAWFVRQDSATIGGTASIKAANIDVQSAELVINANAIKLYSDLSVLADDKDWNDFLVDGEIADANNLDITVGDEIDDLSDYIIYPIEGVELTIGVEDNTSFNVENNRDVVVEVDFSDLDVVLAAAEENIKAYATSVANGASIEDIYFDYTKADADDDLADYYDADTGKYYFYVLAGDTTIETKIASIIDSVVIDFGIIGVNRDQYHYNDKGVAAFDLDGANIGVNVTAVQATEEAVDDVFGAGVWANVAPIVTP